MVVSGTVCRLTIFSGTDRGVCFVLALRRDFFGPWEGIDKGSSVVPRVSDAGVRRPSEPCSLLRSVSCSWIDASDGEGGPELSDLTNGRYQFFRGPDDFQNLCCWTCLFTFDASAASLPVFLLRLGECECLLTKRNPCGAIQADRC